MIVAIDVGGTKIRTSLLNEEGKIIKQITVLTGAQNGKSYILKELFKSIDYVFDSKKVNFIGVAVAGVTDGRVIKEAVNLNFKNLKLASIIEKKYKKPCILENDANAFAFGEYSCLNRKNKEIKNVVGITFGTGVGSGIIINGELYKGFNNSAGELGHMTIDSKRKKCSCGNYDCLELYASPKAIERTYFNLSHHHKRVFDIAKDYNSDKFSRKAINYFAEKVGVALVNTANIIAPQAIVIGGGLSEINQTYKPAEDYFKKHVFPTLKNVKIIKSRFGKNSIAIGIFELYQAYWKKDIK